MGIFNKKITAQDIIEALAGMSDEDREKVMTFAFGEAKTEEKPSAEEAPEEQTPDNEEAATEEAPEATAEDTVEADTETEEATEEEATTEAEAVEEAAEDVKDAEAKEEQEEKATDLSAVLQRMEKLEETVLALANRIGAQEDQADEDQEAPFGYAFGPDAKKATVESDIEKAKREAGFNF